MATVFEPIRPVPPMTTIFMGCPPLSTTQSCDLVQNRPDSRTSVNSEAVGLVQTEFSNTGGIRGSCGGNVSIERRRRDAEVMPMPGLASLALAASMSSPLRPGDGFLAVTTMGA